MAHIQEPLLQYNVLPAQGADLPHPQSRKQAQQDPGVSERYIIIKEGAEDFLLVAGQYTDLHRWSADTDRAAVAGDHRTTSSGEAENAAQHAENIRHRSGRQGRIVLAAASQQGQGKILDQLVGHVLHIDLPQGREQVVLYDDMVFYEGAFLDLLGNIFLPAAGHRGQAQGIVPGVGRIQRPEGRGFLQAGLGIPVGGGVDVAIAGFSIGGAF